MKKEKDIPDRTIFIVSEIALEEIFRGNYSLLNRVIEIWRGILPLENINIEDKETVRAISLIWAWYMFMTKVAENKPTFLNVVKLYFSPDEMAMLNIAVKDINYRGKNEKTHKGSLRDCFMWLNRGIAKQLKKEYPIKEDLILDYNRDVPAYLCNLAGRIKFIFIYEREKLAALKKICMSLVGSAGNAPFMAASISA